MELPAALRSAVDAAVSGCRTADLARAAETLSARYRGEIRDGHFHVADEISALAYAAVRMPATYAAIRDCLEAVGEAYPEFVPRTLLDAGAGPGSAAWAAVERWPSIREAVLLEGSPAFRVLGERLAREGLAFKAQWRDANLAASLADAPRADLVTLSYVLGELQPEERNTLVDRLWQLVAEVLVIVEPGTPAGWTRILTARDRLIQAGAHILAPCPHAARCPLIAPDWCHFARRVARSRIHLRAKGAEVPWEDEKYIYVAAGRRPGRARKARVIAPPRSATGRVWLKLCQDDGSAGECLLTRREGDGFKAARRAGWGDALDVEAGSILRIGEGAGGAQSVSGLSRSTRR